MSGPMIYPSNMEPIELDLVVKFEIKEVGGGYASVLVSAENGKGDVVFAHREEVVDEGGSLEISGLMVLLPKVGRLWIND